LPDIKINMDIGDLRNVHFNDMYGMHRLLTLSCLNDDTYTKLEGISPKYAMFLSRYLDLNLCLEYTYVNPELMFNIFNILGLPDEHIRMLVKYHKPNAKYVSAEVAQRVGLQGHFNYRYPEYYNIPQLYFLDKKDVKLYKDIYARITSGPSATVKNEELLCSDSDLLKLLKQAKYKAALGYNEISHDKKGILVRNIINACLTRVKDLKFLNLFLDMGIKPYNGLEYVVKMGKLPEVRKMIEAGAPMCETSIYYALREPMKPQMLEIAKILPLCPITLFKTYEACLLSKCEKFYKHSLNTAPDNILVNVLDKIIYGTNMSLIPKAIEIFNHMPNYMILSCRSGDNPKIIIELFASGITIENMSNIFYGNLDKDDLAKLVKLKFTDWLIFKPIHVDLYPKPPIPSKLFLKYKTNKINIDEFANTYLYAFDKGLTTDNLLMQGEIRAYIKLMSVETIIEFIKRDIKLDEVYGGTVMEEALEKMQSYKLIKSAAKS
jgi:hypothetical protein